MSVNIVCFDGGGIRGLFTTVMLKSMARDLQEHCGYDLFSNVQLYAGTSTGSFIALGLAKESSQVMLEKIYDVYSKDGENIFHNPQISLKCILSSNAKQALTAAATKESIGGDLDEIWDILKEIAQAKYAVEYTSDGANTGLKPALETLLPVNSTLEEMAASGTPVMVNSLQLYSTAQSQWAPVQIGSADPSFNQMSPLDAALCSGAAPIYFPPHKPAAPSGSDWGYFSDGGLFANNPAAAAYAYSKAYVAPSEDDIRILSFGTGTTLFGVPSSLMNHPECWGGYKWLNTSTQTNVIDGKTVVTPSGLLLEAALAASAQSCGQYASLLAGPKYVRVDVDLTEAVELDDWKAAVAMVPVIEQQTSWTDANGDANTTWQSLVKAAHKALSGE